MTQRIKVGEVYLEVQGAALTPLPEQSIKAEKPSEPEPLEEQHYIYRPNDPFRSAIDEARAIASITSEHQPWVKKAWFLIFIVGSLLLGELYAISQALANPNTPWRSFLSANALFLPIWLIYFYIWRRKVMS